ncbi:PREDICTED: receptor-like protein kinase At5g59670 [Camelina sativa]|uniref:non-specific serine/threonine protein kinase n=1 Tax=Camelina sativa TaxID=90675 RepID=A0ABM0UTQ5_CAMSA|nr:PREDICTED: receptor-like protein kinase At5g59670 [Camelina sativa]
MESSFGLLLVLITLAAIIHIVQAQDQQGFITLDCGLSATGLPPYKDTQTGLWYSSDDEFIQSGKTGQVLENPNNYRKRYLTLRYFPQGYRNCYNLSVDKGRKYLIRASFLYGNYDGLRNNPVFDLYLGPNRLATIDFETRVNGTWENFLHIPTSNSLQLCLVKTGETTPLISGLDLRPLGKDLYITKSGSLRLYYSFFFRSKPISDIQYPDDVYDRIWNPYFQTVLTQISTTLEVNNSNNYVPPKEALKNAATPSNTSEPLKMEWTSLYPNDQYYLYAHFSEIQELKENETREFNMVWNGEVMSTVVPKKLEVSTIYDQSPRTCEKGKCSFQLIRTKRSTLPPLINAFELYTVIELPQLETDERDVVAIKEIEATYALSRIDWQGDPCVPQQLRWDGLNCRNTNISMPPRITALNLSSSGLNGIIVAAIQSLTQLETLDLSNNNLIGGVPEFLGNMKSLSFINLSGNNLTGSIPQALQKKGLTISVEGNPRLCLSDPCRKPPKKNVLVPIVASVVPAAILIIAVLIIFLVLKKKKSTVRQGPHRMSTGEVTFANKNSKRRFTYSEVIQMTNNFQRVLGKGGFGMVYHGTVNGSEQVAVKVLSQSSTQGYKEFKAEVDLLMRVHHTNLVSLVGYCYDGDHLALIYEFLPNGELKQHLSGKEGKSIINWSTRLRIALEAALGLEYLHVGCTPPMVHRDVKTANILLDENFKAKLADFGLSRSFQSGSVSQELTVVAGTRGYLDPEYYRTNRLSEKSDVYSFGIVLLEMITNQPVINNQASEKYRKIVKEY